MIREINIHSDPFDGDIVQTLELSCTKLLKYLEHSQKENITEGNASYSLWYVIFLILEQQTFFVLERLIMKQYKHSKKLLLNHVSAVLTI